MAEQTTDGGGRVTEGWERKGVILAAAWLVPTVLLSVIDPRPAPQWWHGGIVGTAAVLSVWRVGRGRSRAKPRSGK
jgi:hypothetical protein